MLEKIDTASRHLAALVDDVLDMSKIENDKLQLTPQIVSLHSIIFSTLDILQPLAENAIDHGIDVSDNEDPTLWLTIREEDKHIFFEIRDNGAGMTQEKADQILTYQSSGYGVRNVCDRIHVLYGEKGEMKIESTPGKGTRVFIRIPKKTEAKVL